MARRYTTERPTKPGVYLYRFAATCAGARVKPMRLRVFRVNGVLCLPVPLDTVNGEWKPWSGKR